jgi:hypothetical protein
MAMFVEDFPFARMMEESISSLQHKVFRELLKRGFDESKNAERDRALSAVLNGQPNFHIKENLVDYADDGFCSLRLSAKVILSAWMYPFFVQECSIPDVGYCRTTTASFLKQHKWFLITPEQLLPIKLVGPLLEGSSMVQEDLTLRLVPYSDITRLVVDWRYTIRMLDKTNESMFCLDLALVVAWAMILVDRERDHVLRHLARRNGFVPVLECLTEDAALTIDWHVEAMSTAAWYSAVKWLRESGWDAMERKGVLERDRFFDREFSRSFYASSLSVVHDESMSMSSSSREPFSIFEQPSRWESGKSWIMQQVDAFLRAQQAAPSNTVTMASLIAEERAQDRERKLARRAKRKKRQRE